MTRRQPPSNAPQSATLVDLRVICHHGEERAKLLAAADAELDAIVDELLRVERAGGRPNVASAARLADVARSTIYRRLESRRATTTA